MRAAVFHGAGRITIEEVPDPAPAPDGLVVKVARCGVCGGDVSMTSGSAFDYPLGQHIGHECAGEVVAVGRDAHGFKVGDRVACMPASGCGACDICRDGRPILCRAVRGHGGGFADYMTPTIHGAVRLPDSLSLADGALVEPMACGLHALRQAGMGQAGMRGGERILVLGAGAMALAMTFWARRLGAGRIVVASRSDHRREVALAMGADAVVSFDEDDPDALLQALGGPPDIVAECVGKPGLLNRAIAQARVGGTVIAMGMCASQEPVIPAGCTFKEVRLFFPLAYSLAEFEETARAFDDADVRPEIMISEVIALEEVPATIESLRAGKRALKIQVDPTLEPARG
ncbi:alcohol dehydrogenase catalytic domain-containing protein [Phenylobacterium sp. LjRoot225]|uniref:zinc-dependent alcohol dehydrogenase n=1 Tax=Phenylobacterium sp. LjRoot225 TaxID=3342285 RepID=UPI003ECFCEE3